MGKTFYSIPGTSNINSNDSPSPGELEDRISREGEHYRGPLPDLDMLKHSPQFREFYESRKETSHSTIGVDAGEKVEYITPSGEKKDGWVEGEERDQHTGQIDQYVSVPGSGTRKVSWKPDEARTMRLTETKRGS